MSEEWGVHVYIQDLEKAQAHIRELEEQIKDEQAINLYAEKKFTERIAKARAILEHVHSRTWYDDVKLALVALEGK